MNLSTKYLGLDLKSPLVASASPLSSELDNLKKMEDSGSSAVVLESLFEEQLRVDQDELHHFLDSHTDSFAEAQSFFPVSKDFKLGPEEYLNHIRRAKQALKIPVIASLNGSSIGGWTDFASRMQQAGADAIELNLYSIPTDMDLPSSKIEQNYLEVVRMVKSAVKIPVAVKLSPFFTNLAYMANKLDQIGADGLVLFNRFYQPDIELETLEVRHAVLLSNPQARRLPMRWIAILYNRVKADLAATSGIHYGEDAIRMLMVGANVTMVCSAMMRYGIEHIATIQKQILQWMEEHEYESVEQMRGSMSQINCPDPSSYERAHYIKTLQSFKASNYLFRPDESK